MVVAAATGALTAIMQETSTVPRNPHSHIPASESSGNTTRRSPAAQ